MNEKVKSLLKELEKTREIYWNIPPELGQFLHALIQEKNIKSILEIGSSNGYSGIWLADALKANNGHLYTIESHKKERYHLAKKNFEKSGLDNITLILGHAPEDLPLKPKTFNMAFFDATKKEHPKFFEALKDRINPGGLIITDNINSHQQELKPYTDLINSHKNWKSKKHDIGTGILISQKT